MRERRVGEQRFDAMTGDARVEDVLKEWDPHNPDNKT